MFLGKIFRKKKHFVSWLAFYFILLLFLFLLNVFKTFFLGQCPIVCILYLFSNYFKFCLVLLRYFWTEFFIYFGEALGSETVVLEDRLQEIIYCFTLVLVVPMLANNSFLSHCSKCGVRSHCGFNLHFPDD